MFSNCIQYEVSRTRSAINLAQNVTYLPLGPICAVSSCAAVWLGAYTSHGTCRLFLVPCFFPYHLQARRKRDSFPFSFLRGVLVASEPLPLPLVLCPCVENKKYSLISSALCSRNWPAYLFTLREWYVT